LKGAATGRLLKFDPRSGTTLCLAEGIWFANGVALAADESFVLVAETWGLRILRHWLKGPKVTAPAHQRI
jgi:sugar lactone lactonase YvrE